MTNQTLYRKSMANAIFAVETALYSIGLARPLYGGRSPTAAEASDQLGALIDEAITAQGTQGGYIYRELYIPDIETLRRLNDLIRNQYDAAHIDSCGYRSISLAWYKEEGILHKLAENLAGNRTRPRKGKRCERGNQSKQFRLALTGEDDLPVLYGTNRTYSEAPLNGRWTVGLGGMCYILLLLAQFRIGRDGLKSLLPHTYRFALKTKHIVEVSEDDFRNSD